MIANKIALTINTAYAFIYFVNFSKKKKPVVLEIALQVYFQYPVLAHKPIKTIQLKERY